VGWVPQEWKWRDLTALNGGRHRCGCRPNSSSKLPTTNQERRNIMTSVVKTNSRSPKAAYSDFNFFRLAVNFIGDLAGSLNALLTFITNLLNFIS
tara:strand:- start:208 stop:492 length:285 start_codon:yes stop_codon:yes gene_type:complete